MTELTTVIELHGRRSILTLRAITYDYGFGVDNFNDNKSATRFKVVSLGWLDKRA